MPRRIPWLSNTAAAPKTGLSGTIAKTKPAKPPITNAAPATKRQRALPVDAPDDEDPLANIEYMHSSDDEWIMVEDEFLSIAQLYTRSVHRQEYQRLQLEAASKNAGKISNIQRPVVGKPALSKATLLKRKIVAKNEQQKRTLSRLASGDSSEDEDENITRRNTDLMTLMRGDTGSQASLSMLIPQKTVVTRAAAGYTDSQASSQRRHLVPVHNQQNAKPSALAKPSGMVARKPVSAIPASVTSTDDDDDLDAPVVKHRKQSMNPPRQPTSSTAPASWSATQPVKTEILLDSDDDLDAPVMKQRKHSVNSLYQSASIPLSISTRSPSVNPMESERSVVPAARRPSKQEFLLDSDDDFPSLMSTKPINSRFKGRSMAARERATKEAI